MPRGAALIRSGTVTVDIGEPIPTAGLKTEDRNKLINDVHARVAEMLGEAPAAAAASVS